MIDKNYNYFVSITAEKYLQLLYIIKTLLKGVKNNKSQQKRLHNIFIYVYNITMDCNLMFPLFILK